MSDTLRTRLTVDTQEGAKDVDLLGALIDGVFDKVHTVRVDADKSGATIKELADAAQKALASSDISIDVRSANVEKVQSDLDSLFDTQRKALIGLKAGGKENSEEYQSLLQATKGTKKALDELAKSGEEVNKALDLEEPKSALEQLRDLAKSALAFEAAGKAGDYLSGLAEKGNALRDAMRSLSGQTGATGDELKQLQSAARDAFVGGVGESIAEVTKHVGTAKQQLGEFLDNRELGPFVAQAGAIGQVFEKDINEVILKSRTYVAQFGLSGKEATDLISLGFQKAGTGSDDLLDTLSEYSQHFKTAGYDAEESMGLLIAGAQAGTRDLDKLADASKEATIRLKAGDISSALSGITSPITASIQEIVRAGEQGQLSVKEVLQKTTQITEEAFDSGKISESIRSQLQVAVAGTPAEDLGSEIYAKVFGAKIDPEIIKAQAVLAGEQIGSAIEPKGITEKIGRAFSAFGEEASATFAPIISGGADVLKTLSSIGPGVNLVRDSMKGLKEAGGFAKLASDALGFGKAILSKVIPGVIAQTAATGAQTVATGAATTATAALNATMLLNPALLIAAGIAALVGAFLIFGDSTESVQEAVEGVDKSLESFNAKMEATATIDKQQNHLKGLADEHDRLKNSTDPEAQKRFAEVTNELATAMPEAVRATDEFGNVVDAAKEKTQVSTDVVRAFADSQLELNENIRQGAVADLAKEMQDLSKSGAEARGEVEDLSKKKEQLIAQLEKIKKDGSPYSKWAIQETEKKLRDVTSELGEQSKELQQSEEATRRGIKAFKDQGMSVDEIASRIGKTNEETQRYVVQIEAAEKAEQEAARAASVLQGNTYDAVQASKALADGWNKAKAEIDAAVNTSRAALSQILLDLKRLEERKANTNELNFLGQAVNAFEEGRLKAQKDQTIASGKQAIAQRTEREEIDKTSDSLLDLAKNTTTAAASTVRLEKQVLDFTDTWVKAERAAGDIRENLRIKGIKDDEQRLVAENDNRLRLIRRSNQDELDEIDKKIADATKKETKLLEKAREQLADAEKANDEKKIAQARELVKKREQAIENNNNVEIIALKEARDALAQQQLAQEEEASADLLEKQKQLLQQRLTELTAVQLQMYDAETALLTLKKEQRGQNDGVAIEDSLQLELDLIDRSFDQQEKKLAEQTKVYADYYDELTATAKEKGITDAEVARLLEAKKQEIILTEQAAGNKQFELLAAQRSDAEVKAVEASSEAWEAWFEEWSADQDKQSKTLELLLGVQEAIYSAHIDALTEEQRRGIEERLSLLDKESDALRDEYSRGEKSYQEYIDKLVDIARQKAEAEEELANGSVSFQDEVNGRLAASFQKAQENAAANLQDSLKDIKNLPDGIGGVLEDVVGVTATALGEAAVTGESIAKAGANSLIDIATQTLTALIASYIPQIFGSAIGFAGPILGSLLAAGATATLYGLASIAKSALAGAKFLKGGEITGPKQMIWVNEDNRPEYVIDHPTYRKWGKGFFDALRSGDNPIAAAFKSGVKMPDAIPISERFHFRDMRSPGIVEQIHLAANGNDRETAKEIRALRKAHAEVVQKLAQQTEALQETNNQLEMIRTQESFRKVGVEVTTNTDVIAAREAEAKAIRAARS